MSWTFKLVTAPVELFSTTTPGLVNGRHMLPILGNAGFPYHESVEMDLGPDGMPFIPSITGFKPRTIVSDRLRGSARVTRPLRELIRLRVAVDSWTPTDWMAFGKLYNTQRLVAFSPYWSPRTFWSSTFAGQDEGGGLAEIGESGEGTDQWRIREPTGAWESPVMGAEQLVSGDGNNNAIMKLVPGMIGRALLIESARDQYANTLTASPGWIAAPSFEHDAIISNIPDGPRASIFLVAGDEAFFPATSSRPSGDFIASCYVRGDGKIKINFQGFDGTIQSPEVTLTDAWQKVEVPMTTTAAGVTQISAVESTATDVALLHISAPMIEDGLYATSYLQAGLGAGVADKLFINDQIPGAGGGMMFIFWYKALPVRDDTVYFASWRDGSSNRYIRMRNGAYETNIAGTVFNPSSSATPGEWTQIIFRLEITAGTAFKIRAFENGAGIGGGTQSAPSGPIGDAGIYIGSDLGLGSPGDIGLNTPLDACRIEMRAWTDQEILDDYTMRTDPGIQAFLQQTAGRLFQITGVPSGFRGPFTDEIVGDITLEEVAHVPAGLV